jgi:Peptidase family C25
MRKIDLFEKSFAFIVVGLLICSGLGLIPIQTQATISNSGYDFIIITLADFTNELQPLVADKEQHGITTKIVTLDDIYNGIYFAIQGRDNAEKIKYFIKNAYDSWNISYVLFVGSPIFIPLRRSNTIPEADVLVNFTSELYYADIYDAHGNFSSWDSDNDGIFGEWYNKSKAEDIQQDLTPEIALGRLPCNDAIEVRGIVNKIIQYESTPADPSWFHTMVVAGGETFVEYPGLEGEIMTQNALDVMTGFKPVKLWYSNGNLDLLGFHIVRAINNGCGFLYLAGHGNTYIWATLNPKGKTASMFSILNIPLLHNQGEYPVCILGGCHVCKIEKSNCLGWQLTKNQKKGAIATIGPTNVGYFGFEYNGGGMDKLELQFFKEYMNGTTIIGDIWRQTLIHFLEMYPIDWNLPAGENCAIDAKMVQEWILLGDPTLKIGGYSS